MLKYFLSFTMLCLTTSGSFANEMFFTRCTPVSGVQSTDDPSVFVDLRMNDLSTIVVRIENEQRRAAVVLEREGEVPIPYIYDMVARNRSENAYNFQVNTANTSSGLLIYWDEEGKGMAKRSHIDDIGVSWFASYVCNPIN